MATEEPVDDLRDLYGNDSGEDTRNDIKEQKVGETAHLSIAHQDQSPLKDSGLAKLVENGPADKASGGNKGQNSVTEAINNEKPGESTVNQMLARATLAGETSIGTKIDVNAQSFHNDEPEAEQSPKWHSGQNGSSDQKVGNQTNGAPEFEMDSSPYESSSSDSDSTSSDDDSDDQYELLTPAEQARRLMEDDGSDDEKGKKDGGSRLKTANEVLQEVGVIPDVEVTPEMKIVELGRVENFVDNMALIKASVTGEYQVLEADSLLCLEDRTVIGVVAETLGKVTEPLYSVLFPSSAEIEKFGIVKGKPVYYVPGHATFVFTRALQGIKGSDASNIHDEEVGDHDVEFSDDEAEAEYKRSLKQAKQAKRGGKTKHDYRDRGTVGSRNRDGGYAPGDSSLGATEVTAISYDDDHGAPYTPLARPPNLHEMMEKGAPAGHRARDGHSRGFRGSGRGRDRGGYGRGRGRGNRRESSDRSNAQQHPHDSSMPISPQYPHPQSQGFQPPSSPSFHAPPPPPRFAGSQPPPYPPQYGGQHPPFPPPPPQFAQSPTQPPFPPHNGPQPGFNYQGPNQQQYSPHYPQMPQAPPPNHQHGAYPDPSYYMQPQPNHGNAGPGGFGNR